MKRLFTSESVTEGHPDKICDQISDAVLDAILSKDPNARVACETCTTTGLVMVMGEITTNCYVDIPKVVRETIREIGYDRAKYGFDCDTCAVITSIDEQSGDIAMGVDEGLESKSGEQTEEEIEKMLIDFNATEESEEFKKWYNGYIFGDTVIYNPWSVLSYLKDKNNEFMPYWVNTSENKIIKTIIARSSEELKKSFEQLLRGNTIETTIDENIIMADIEANENNIWSFLLLSGYLKVVGKRRENNRIYYSLAIPNIEVQFMYEKIIEDWQGESYVAYEYNEMLKALVNFDYEVFEEIFVDYVQNSLSYFDVSGKEPERVYHAFVLGMLVSLSNTHYVLSNKESGYGRYDVMIIPKDKNKLGIIIEFKKARITNKKSIEELIEDKKYETELVSRGITNIKKLVIVFKGKEVSVNDVT